MAKGVFKNKYQMHYARFQKPLKMVGFEGYS